MNQTTSVAEAIANALIGYGVALAAQAIVFPWFGIHASLSQNMGIGLAFTVVSLARSYCLRRIFNGLRR
jgi:hypothetical protein